MAVRAAGTMTPAATPPPPAVVEVGGFSAGGELPGDVTDSLDEFLGHPTHGRQNLAEREPRKDAAALLDAVLALPRGPFFQGVVYCVSDSASLFHRLAHGKDQAGDGGFRPLLKMKALDGMMADTVPAAGFTKVRMALAGVD